MRRKEQLDSYEKVKEKALRLLEFRAHSEYELSVKLRQADASDEHIEQALEFCRRYGFVNDREYAVRKAKDLQRLKKYGSKRIKSELKAKGIDGEIIEEAIGEIDVDEENRILISLAAKKLGGDFSDKNKDKCLRYLAYRGYDIYDIKDAIRTAEQEGLDEI
jgi:regulatory protein